MLTGCQSIDGCSNQPVDLTAIKQDLAKPQHPEGTKAINFRISLILRILVE